MNVLFKNTAEVTAECCPCKARKQKNLTLFWPTLVVLPFLALPFRPSDINMSYSVISQYFTDAKEGEELRSDVCINIVSTLGEACQI